MNKVLSYIIGLIMVVFALIPPIDFRIVAPQENFPWIFLMVCFAGFYLLLLRTSVFIKAVVAVGFINTFMSDVPLVSFIAFISIVACAYFYYFCQKIKVYSPVIGLLQALLILNVAVHAMQLSHNDPLMNFTGNSVYGIVGQHMQSSSFSVVLAAVLLCSSTLNLAYPLIVSVITNAVGGFVSAMIGLILYNSFCHKAFKIILMILGLLVGFCVWMNFDNKVAENILPKDGRLAVWLSTIDLTFNSVKHAIIGYGVGTYKVLFHVITDAKNVGANGQVHTIPWKTAHNCWLQLLFEGGLLMASVFISYISVIVYKLIKLLDRDIFKKQAVACLAGIAMISANMMVHFPTRMIQTVLLIIFFLTYCERIIDYGSRQSSNS
jgi:hypothetical protein